MTVPIDIELQEILVRKGFKSILACIEYLYYAGYKLPDAYEIASSLYYEPRINLYPNHPYTFEEIEFIRLLDGCTIQLEKEGTDAYFMSLIYNNRDGSKQFYQNLYSRQFCINWQTPAHLDECIPHVLNNYLGLTGYKIIRSSL